GPRRARDPRHAHLLRLHPSARGGRARARGPRGGGARRARATALGGRVSSRLQFPRSELRARPGRGAIATAAFLVAIDGLVLGQGLIVTRLLGPSEIGLYGIVSTTVVTVLALKRVGIHEAFGPSEAAPPTRE